MKALGYSISAVSVVLLGAVAWPGPGEPRWKAIALIIGMTLSMIGMTARYLSHRKDKRALELALSSRPVKQ